MYESAARPTPTKRAAQLQISWSIMPSRLNGSPGSVAFTTSSRYMTCAGLVLEIRVVPPLLRFTRFCTGLVLEVRVAPPLLRCARLTNDADRHLKHGEQMPDRQSVSATYGCTGSATWKVRGKGSPGERLANTFGKLRSSGASSVLLTLSVATNSGRSEPSVCMQQGFSRAVQALDRQPPAPKLCERPCRVNDEGHIWRMKESPWPEIMVDTLKVRAMSEELQGKPSSTPSAADWPACPASRASWGTAHPSPWIWSQRLFNRSLMSLKPVRGRGRGEARKQAWHSVMHRIQRRVTGCVVQLAELAGCGREVDTQRISLVTSSGVDLSEGTCSGPH